jgi:hypothetical protein
MWVWLVIVTSQDFGEAGQDDLVRYDVDSSTMPGWVWDLLILILVLSLSRDIFPRINFVLQSSWSATQKQVATWDYRLCLSVSRSRWTLLAKNHTTKVDIFIIRSCCCHGTACNLPRRLTLCKSSSHLVCLDAEVENRLRRARHKSHHPADSASNGIRYTLRVLSEM